MSKTISEWLDESVAELSGANINTAHLDAEIILSFAIGKNRTYLHAHSDRVLTTKNIKNADNYLARRLQHEPLAYIIGYKEFFGRRFKVTSDTLVPRPESEDIIESLERILLTTDHHQPQFKLLDVGAGSGCLGITAKLEFPFLDVTLIDISENALLIARQNANQLGSDVRFLKSDLLQNYTDKPDIVVANLPYVNPSWERSPETEFEPHLSLFSDENGMMIIKKLIAQSTGLLGGGGYLIIEADPVQHSSLIEYAKTYNFKIAFLNNYTIGFKKLRNASTNTIEK
ncbi:MAG TPA: peptide chain release factor N(5)-glutamine methyltransferase [Candidatus Saccharimonadales bacterium]|nr:peptide chain release factor N(5)-glutamine methyltransferase [Candidatus Saccharimonadales bacterium]